MSQGDPSGLSPFQQYKVRVLPWGETCAQAETRLKELRLRPRWRERLVKLNKLGAEFYEACWQAHLEFSPERCEELLEQMPISEGDEAFIEECRAGLNMMLPQRAGIEKEYDWIGANLNCSLPDLASCPSKWCINYIMDLRVSERKRDTFWATSLAKRLSPGDVKSKKKGAVQEDVEDAEDEAHEEELRRRLFGSD